MMTKPGNGFLSFAISSNRFIDVMIFMLLWNLFYLSASSGNVTSLTAFYLEIRYTGSAKVHPVGCKVRLAVPNKHCRQM